MALGFSRALKYNSSYLRSHLRYRQLRDLWLSVFGGGLLGSPCHKPPLGYNITKQPPFYARSIQYSVKLSLIFIYFKFIYIYLINLKCICIFTTLTLKSSIFNNFQY